MGSSVTIRHVSPAGCRREDDPLAEFPLGMNYSSNVSTFAVKYLRRAGDLFARKPLTARKKMSLSGRSSVYRAPELFGLMGAETILAEA